ncbi:LD-carboxypeptidase [Halomonas beimenensis]|uniref:Muramoyltetrapeptide carboxypeptidase n=1 Tax=Halomonas beimenensis TaxID=475662 RepID=A0A291PB05_9GAMM|nr:LD-carboxypeptidase [Halomonas beimenensis]ATJ84077.1 muramoyltetrapeptide carboxypeptidase [Halomonas beimenensis]
MPLAVSLIAPSSFTAPEAVAAGIRGLEALGVEVRGEAPLQAPERYLAASREHRLAQLHAAYDDPETQAVWAVRGGYGAAQLVDGIDWHRLARRPKPLIGYSDVTVLLDQCHRHGLPALHGPVAKAAGGLLEDSDAERAIIRRQFEETLALIQGPAPLDYPLTAQGDAPARLEGPVVGGNLTTLASLVGTPTAFTAPKGALVILEDVGEPYYRLERALWQLVHGGALTDAAAVCLGTFEGCTPYGETPLEAIVAETLAPLGLPLFAGLPVGHGLHNRPWRYGATGRLEGGRLFIEG